ncbi:NAD(P)-dependent alcohol dehydrogenase [Cuniculiplasma divulgatum]|jgi:uncharacterized zinc-type alcohol dehydrogenase-like protein|uniref:Alcohol dehydrogenase (NADP+) n=1 Tax=Cuniculiplasma divulgatum TaxID=1673428 RepID=A0A1N5UC75_9ARCH|nr:NAD(P)-dependent alcohol dehydrogenase [Cuniculiplasma divulgatum]EQB69906.1 MAG: hypothetical protein AMDU5_GPLC00001G0124 [Thermoplasmatales archaeon Gpl]MCI2411851.1 NAD(P)-dependent alcohol dehydrogenase [Cuniculiplasma sp.]WMT49039.1 MAG: NAD(P)-dependent alcohol dehydrogenase [Thermoplasmatales archaeon]SIM58424.1 alcohol dehydrogenase (NADP+) [Cuniculiplasma divulgatum]SJK84739.1 alcohol dehydrogenase (NADP+) [Cuniculiplasma divulgatum]
MEAKGYAAGEAGGKLSPYNFERRELGEKDVLIDIKYCGICHSDIHQVNNDWGGASYPMVPGHEIVGIVRNVGSGVKKFKQGDRVGVGCMVDSCGQCGPCKSGLQQYCENGATFTYSSKDKVSGGVTYGGYSDKIVVVEDFVLKVSEKLDFAATAPLLCAGITTYSPLKHWNVKAGQTVGVAGLGGLGHMAVKLAKSMGANVVVMTTSEKKKDEAKRLGADKVIISKNIEEMKKNRMSMDLIIDTIPAPHDMNLYISLLKIDGSIVLVGLPEKESQHVISAGSLINGRRSISGSNIGGIEETQEMLDYCDKHNIVSDIELIPMSKVNEAYVRTVNSDVKYRFVIDMSTL